MNGVSSYDRWVRCVSYDRWGRSIISYNGRWGGVSVLMMEGGEGCQFL